MVPASHRRPLCFLYTEVETLHGACLSRSLCTGVLCGCSGPLSPRPAPIVAICPRCSQGSPCQGCCSSSSSKTGRRSSAAKPRAHPLCGTIFCCCATNHPDRQPSVPGGTAGAQNALVGKGHGSPRDRQATGTGSTRFPSISVEIKQCKSKATLKVPRGRSLAWPKVCRERPSGRSPRRPLGDSENMWHISHAKCSGGESCIYDE